MWIGMYVYMLRVYPETMQLMTKRCLAAATVLMRATIPLQTHSVAAADQTAHSQNPDPDAVPCTINKHVYDMKNKCVYDRGLCKHRIW